MADRQRQMVTSTPPDRLPHDLKLILRLNLFHVQGAPAGAHDESEQATGFYSMLENHLVLPFKTEVLGVEVLVERIDITDDDQIVAVCARGKSRQRIPIVELPLPDPSPEASEWIHAYRRWARGT